MMEGIVRRSTIFVSLMTCIIGACLFQLKYEVMSLESQYKNICHSIKNSERSISILKAEWAHLTNPQRLQLLAHKHLGIHPLTQKQVISFRRGGTAQLSDEGSIVRTGVRSSQGKAEGVQSVAHITTSEIHTVPEVPIAIESRPSSAKMDSGENDLEKILDEVHDRPNKKIVAKAPKITRSEEDAMDSLLSELALEGRGGQLRGKRLQG